MNSLNGYSFERCVKALNRRFFCRKVLHIVSDSGVRTEKEPTLRFSIEGSGPEQNFVESNAVWFTEIISDPCRLTVTLENSKRWFGIFKGHRQPFFSLYSLSGGAHFCGVSPLRNRLNGRSPFLWQFD